MNFVYDHNVKPSTRRAIGYMMQVCRAHWADHRASLRAYRKARAASKSPALAQDTPQQDRLYQFALACAAVAAAAVVAVTCADLFADFRGWLGASGAAALVPPRRKPKALAHATQEWQQTPAVEKVNTKHTVAPSVAGPRCISRVADESLGVPGWNKPAPLRDGALDFKGYMHDGSAFRRPPHLAAKPNEGQA